jgi:FixJ family two-component response regulator
MMADKPLVSVVDDDQSVRESLPDLLLELGFSTRAFASAEEFLSSGSADETRVLILDISMPGMSGPSLHHELRRIGKNIPTIFITADRDETIRPRLINAGAVDCLFKPFSEAALLQALDRALAGT